MMIDQRKKMVFSGTLLQLVVLALVHCTCPCSATAQSKEPQLIFKYGRGGDAAQIKRLIDSGEDVNCRDQDGYTPLMFAVENPAATKLLINTGADVNAHDNRGLTVLMHAAGAGEATEVLRLLLKSGAKTNIPANDGSTALMFAVEHPLNLKLLLQARADCSIRDSEGATAYDRAKRLHAHVGARLLVNCH